MTTTSGTGRKDKVYRYYPYRNQARQSEDRCSHPRLSALEVEELVISRVRHVCADQTMREQITKHIRVAKPDMAARIQEQRAAEQVTQTIRILDAFDEVWAAFNAAERHDLVLILVEKVTVNEPAGKLDIEFHDLSFLEAGGRRRAR